jgi:hypothetical protein
MEIARDVDQCDKTNECHIDVEFLVAELTKSFGLHLKYLPVKLLKALAASGCDRITIFGRDLTSKFPEFLSAELSSKFDVNGGHAINN